MARSVAIRSTGGKAQPDASGGTGISVSFYPARAKSSPSNADRLSRSPGGGSAREGGAAKERAGRIRVLAMRLSSGTHFSDSARDFSDARSAHRAGRRATTATPPRDATKRRAFRANEDMRGWRRGAMRREEANRGGRPGTRRAFVCFRSRGSPPSSNSSFVFASIAHVLARAPRARRSENSRPREGAPKEMRAGRWDGQVPPLPTAPLRCVRARTMPRDARGPRANARESSGAPLQAPGPRATCANRERGPRGNAVRASRGPRCLFSRVVQEICSRVCGRERLAANRRSANPDFQRNLEPEKVDSFGERKSFKPRKEPGPVSAFPLINSIRDFPRALARRQFSTGSSPISRARDLADLPCFLPPWRAA